MSAVILTHALDTAGYPGHEGMGIVGLTCFFVLSGYLITGILMNDLHRFGRIRYREFYWNRAVRLLPALSIVLVAYVALESTINRTSDPIGSSVAIAAVYAANLPGLRELTGTLRDMWSLAFEEQFYFVWPVALAFFVRRGRALPFTLVAIAASVLLLLLSIALSWQQPDRLYTLPTTWASPVLIGCLGRLNREDMRAWVAPGLARGAALLLLSSAIIIASAVLWLHDQPWMYLGGPFVVGLAALVLVLWAEEWRDVRHPLMLPLVGIGTISYAAYLWNYPITMYLHEYVTDPGAEIALSVSITIVMAVLSWYFIEKPSLRFKSRPSTKPTSRSVATSTA